MCTAAAGRATHNSLPLKQTIILSVLPTIKILKAQLELCQYTFGFD